MSDERGGNDKDTSVAKTAGFVVFSGIAVSILKALNPFNNNKNESESLAESTQPLPPKESIVKKPITCTDQDEPKSSHRSIEIVKGDTLWGLSRKYGVSIDEIKEANGLTGDTIYAGKKLIIP